MPVRAPSHSRGPVVASAPQGLVVMFLRLRWRIIIRRCTPHCLAAVPGGWLALTDRRVEQLVI
jgi:hypothetical protein